MFGSHKYHERRASGRRRAAPGLVVTGAVRVVAGLATRLRPEALLELPPNYVGAWRRVRAELDQRREARRQQCRFRRDPAIHVTTKAVQLLDQIKFAIVVFYGVVTTHQPITRRC